MSTLTGIHNENEFYSHHYLAEIFAGDVQATLERWRKEAEAASARTPHAELRTLAPEYQRFRREFAHERSAGQRILKQREWFRRLLPALGYACKPGNHLLEDGSEVPILCAVGGTGGNAGSPRLLMRFDFDEILGRREEPTLKATAALLHRESLLPASGQSLLDGLDENSHRHAFGVSEDLKHALRESIELIGKRGHPASARSLQGARLRTAGRGARPHAGHRSAALHTGCCSCSTSRRGPCWTTRR